MRKDALKNQTTAAKYQKTSYDKGLKPANFKIGDYVGYGCRIIQQKQNFL